MPVYVDNFTTDTEITQGNMPLESEQIEQIVRLVMKRMAERDRNARSQREASELRNTSVPPMHSGHGGGG